MSRWKIQVSTTAANMTASCCGVRRMPRPTMSTLAPAGAYVQRMACSATVDVDLSSRAELGLAVHDMHAFAVEGLSRSSAVRSR